MLIRQPDKIASDGKRIPVYRDVSMQVKNHRKKGKGNGKKNNNHSSDVLAVPGPAQGTGSNRTAAGPFQQD